MSEYTEEEIQAAHDFIAGEVGFDAPMMRMQAERLVATMAPVIAARALREAAERYSEFPRPAGLIPKEWADGFMDALNGVTRDLRGHADDIANGRI